MVLKVRMDASGRSAYVEMFKSYRNGDKGYIEVVCSINPEGNIAPAYVMRGGDFIPASEIDSEMGIEKYTQAKKPFYTMLEDGFIAKIRAGVDYSNNSLIEGKTIFSIYQPSEVEPGENGVFTLKLVKLLELSDELNKLLISKAREIASSGWDRNKYIRNRMVRE